MSDEVTLAGWSVLPAGRLDGWQNVYTGLGVSGKDKGMATSFGAATVLDQHTLEQLYRGDPLAARVVDLPPDDETREWIEFKHGDDPEAAKAVMQALGAIDAREHIKEARQWARLFGGALVVLGINDGQAAEKRVNESAIQTVEIVAVLDRWQAYPNSYYTDPSKPSFGKVETYRLSPVAAEAGIGPGMVVHESRTVRFDGVRLPARLRAQNHGWGDSVLNRVYQAIQAYQGSHGVLPTIIQEFIQNTYKLQGLAQYLSQGGQSATDKVVNRLRTMQIGKSIFQGALLDENESLERQSLTVTGLDKLFDQLERRLVTATGIPHTLLLGESPGASLGEGGASENRDWYDHVAAVQEAELRKPLAYLLRLLLLAKQGPTGGQVPALWGFEFRPLWQMDAKEEADIRKAQAEADGAYLDRGVLSPEEVATSRFGGDGCSTATTLIAGTVRVSPTPAAPAPEVKKNTDDARDLIASQFAEWAKLDDEAIAALVVPMRRLHEQLLEELGRINENTFTEAHRLNLLAQVRAFLELTEGRQVEGLAEVFRRAIETGQAHTLESIRDIETRLGDPMLVERMRGIRPAIPVDMVTRVADAQKLLLTEYRGLIFEGLSEELALAVAAGESIPKASRRVGALFEAEAWKLERIARTEIANGMNAGHQSTLATVAGKFPEMGLQKRWSSHLDTRTSDRCRNGLNGQVRQVDQQFQADDGWTGMHPPAHPNCRSRVIPYSPRWEAFKRNRGEE